MKNKLERGCTVCGIVAAFIGIWLLGSAAWRWFDNNFADTVTLMLKLF